jgi:hypothetical protein
MFEASSIFAKYHFNTKLAQIPIAKTQAIIGKYMSKTNYALIPSDLKIEG